jgi:hypothetical protein
MVKKSVWALCTVALLAVAFALPASAQDVAISARATQMHVVRGQEPNIPPPAVIYMNLGTYVAANCPNGNGDYTGCSWTPDGAYICGTGASACSGSSQNVGYPFTPKVASTMHHLEVPVQTDGGSSTSFTASVQADSGGLPTGTYLASVHTHATAAFWTCCGTGAAGGLVIPMTQALAAATQYWIVVDTNNAADVNTQNVWASSGLAPYIGYCVGAAPCTAYGNFIANTSPAMKVY